MIKPIQPNLFTKKIEYSTENQTQNKNLSKAAENNETSLVNAYYVPLNITFKHRKAENSSKPVETTANYLNGINKTDFENSEIHVFEYPDTKLRVLVNIDKSLDKAASPTLFMLLNQVDTNNYNLLYEKLLQVIIENRLDDLEKMNFAGTPFSVSFNAGDFTQPDVEAKRVNNILFNTPIDEREFKIAKNQLINSIKNNRLNDSLAENVKIFFDKDNLKTDEEMIDELSNLSIKDFKEYVDNYKSNLSMDITIITSEDYFKQNKDKLFFNINQGISNKLKSVGESQDREVSDKDIKNVSAKRVGKAYHSLNYPISDLEPKDFLISNMAVRMLYPYFEKEGYILKVDNAPLPIELKNTNRNVFDGKYLTIQKNNKSNFDKSDIEKVNDIVSKFVSADLQEDLQEEKNYYKSMVNNFMTGSTLPIGRVLIFADYSDKLLTISNDIDSITENELKNYIKDNILS